MHVERFQAVPDALTMADLRDVYTSAFSQPPYQEDRSHGHEFLNRIQTYAAERDGLAVDVVTSKSLVVGVALSVVAHPGDWWRDKVEASLGSEAAAEWLGSACREVVHVAVRPNHQRSGFGRALMDHIVANANAPTIVLSCHPDATAAQRLYLSCGFTVLSKTFSTAPEQPDYWLMARTAEVQVPC